MGTANYDIDLLGEWKFLLGEPPRKKKLSNNDYHIMAEAGGALYEYELEFADWEEITLPHDWLTYLPYDKKESPMNGYKARGEGWYLKKISLPREEIESARIVFDGILGISTVYINGTVAVRNFSGYNRFSAEIGDYLVAGEENTIVIRVNATRGEGWFYEGAGFYRGARIELREFSHIEKESLFVFPKEKNGFWYADFSLDILGECCGLTLSAFVTDGSGREIVKSDSEAIKSVSFSLPCLDISLWSPESPTLYRLTIELKRGDAVIDSLISNIGFRKIEFSLSEGMLLNGAPYLVKGICAHQDHAGVGAAVTDEINEYRIRKLKGLGVNAYRTAHHAVTDSFLSVCDRLGILVMVENRTFSSSEAAIKELSSMVSVSRNHPSVFLYSLFNEEPWQNEKRGLRIARRLREVVLALDSTRPVTAAQNSGILEKNNASDALDIIGVNYNLNNYEACHKRTPDKLILGTENAPTFATRGCYATDRAARVFSSYGDDYADWFSESLDETMEAVQKHPFVIGSFVWCGFEHRGEPVPYDWPSVTSHWGFTDACGFEKDTAYLLKAHYSQKLMAHLLPHWNFCEGENVRVMAFTNADEAELFLNGKSLGKKTVERRRTEWSVGFEEGTVTLKAFRGSECIICERRTAKEAARIIIEDETCKKENPASRIINLKITDDIGTLIYNFDKNVEISVVGGKILGVGNGNPNSHHNEKADIIPAFAGRAQIIISGETEAITLTSGTLSAMHSFGDKNERS